MSIFTNEETREALFRRRIKFVVEKGAMARLFKAGSHAALQDEIFRRLIGVQFGRFKTRINYDKWLVQTVESQCWQRYSRFGLSLDRWAYFAKLFNIVVYEIVANRELVSDAHWQRLRPFLHVPIDN